MSRPPRPLFRESTTARGEPFAANRQFQPHEFNELVTLQRELAESEANLGVTREPGDFAHTLFELSALVGHTLAMYQNLYAREAFLSTAETERSLVLHARRLAYAPDQGLAASGYVVLTIGSGLAGTLPEGFAMASSPRGEIKAQTFETLDALEVDAARNQARPVDRERAASMTFVDARGSFWLAGRALALERGAYGLLIRDSDTTWEAVSIVDLVEDVTRDATQVVVDLLSGTSSFTNSTEDLQDSSGLPTTRFLAMPKLQLHRFGWDANPVLFPPAAVNTEDEYGDNPPVNPGDVEHGYDVTRENGGGLRDRDVFLSTTVDTSLLGTYVLGAYANSIEPLLVTEQASATVALRRGEIVSFPTGQLDGSNNPIFQETAVETQINATGTYLRLRTHGNLVLDRAQVRLPRPLFGDWQFEADVLATEPNTDPIPSPLAVDADFGELRPGGVVVFETLDGAVSQAREVQQLTVLASGHTELHTRDLTAAPSAGWTLGNLKVFGNVARITHGESHDEILGGSDGVTMFLRFELKKAPLTLVPGAAGGEPEITVFVNDVEWTRVDDFFDSGPHDRHYRLEVDDAQTASVVFGNGIRGAIPPSGKKHIRAEYRQGLGVYGNAAARAVSRIKKAHPLVTHATNATALAGGADAAGLSDLQRQATRFIRTFDRAVSVQDHADLALLFPGVARAAARPVSPGIEVVVATADGGEPVLDEVRSFLNARRDDTLALTVLGPEAVDVFLDLVVEHDAALLTENVKRGVQDALVGADARGAGLLTFPAREFGQAAHLSEVYERVAAVEGVTFVDVTRFRIGNNTGVADVLQVNARQWLRLLAANLAIAIAPGAAE